MQTIRWSNKLNFQIALLCVIHQLNTVKTSGEYMHIDQFIWIHKYMKHRTVSGTPTLASPPSDGWRMCVSFEFRYGMCSWPLRRAVNTYIWNLNTILWKTKHQQPSDVRLKSIHIHLIIYITRALRRWESAHRKPLKQDVYLSLRYTGLGI